MSPSFERISAEALVLPPEERERLSEQLMASLEYPTISTEWMTEIRRRQKEIHDGEAVTVPAFEALDEIRNQLRG